jgi:hypothetical protein
MQRFAALVATGLFVVSCPPEGEVTESTNKSATHLHSSYNPKVHDQCVDVCIKCNHGIMTTCSTSCTLRGGAEVRTKKSGPKAVS